MRAFLLSQVIEQLADTGILSPHRGPFIKSPGFDFDCAGLPPDRIEPEWPHQPNRRPRHKTLHVLPSNQRDVLTELLPIRLDESSTMARFVAAHSVKHRSRGGEILLEAFGKIGVNPLVLFFKRNSQRQSFTFRMSDEAFQDYESCYPCWQRGNTTCNLSLRNVALAVSGSISK